MKVGAWSFVMVVGRSTVRKQSRMAIEVQPLTALVGLAIIGLFSGLGNAAGQYVFNNYLKRHVLDKMDKLGERKNGNL
jgi:hypothetical protein